METLNALERDVLERMIDALKGMEGRDGYVSDLAFAGKKHFLNNDAVQ